MEVEYVIEFDPADYELLPINGMGPFDDRPRNNGNRRYATLSPETFFRWCTSLVAAKRPFNIIHEADPVHDHSTH